MVERALVLRRSAAPTQDLYVGSTAQFSASTTHTPRHVGTPGQRDVSTGSHVLGGPAGAARGRLALAHGDDVSLLAGLDLEGLGLSLNGLVIIDGVAVQERRLQVRALVGLGQGLALNLENGRWGVLVRVCFGGGRWLRI